TTNNMITEEIMELFAITHLLVILFDRDLNLLNFFLNPEDKSYFTTVANKGIPATDSGIEYISASCKEEILGTTAMAMALRYGCPSQTIGPENFHDTLRPTILSAAPITDNNSRTMGVLALTREAPEEYWTNEAHRDQINALYWTSTMASSISQQIHIKERNKQLRDTNRVLEATLTFIDEGILLTENNGKILKANRRSLDILGIEEETEKQYNLNDYLSDDSQLKHMLSLRANVNGLEDTLRLPGGSQKYLFSLRPILGEKSEGADSMVIRISDPRQIDTYFAQRNSNIASFTFGDILGKSAAINKAKDIAMRFASSYENILLLGESGTGKELFAQAIHNTYHPHGPFIALNCAAMPRSLVESELLGYEGGSFTGAERKGRPGKIEMAQGGTLFLDEIGDMPYEVQGVLLRVLENHQVMRIGSNKYTNVEFRLIAATNQDLQKLVENRLFREDLYYRLSALKIIVPPLRKRDQDVLLLAEHFIADYCTKMQWALPELSQEAKELILDYDWPGNVRQLQKAMIYASTSMSGTTIAPADFPDEITANTVNTSAQSTHTMQMTSIDPIKDAEAQIIRQALLSADSNVAAAAKYLKIGRSTLYKKINKFNIKLPLNKDH
ncbi:MAG: sigma 54-interacting transcriptional regulator, partial [Bacillota bacterium]|nr:sigma 54-interacting transcriptional regulator [Bacillota bacterium]